MGGISWCRVVPIIATEEEAGQTEYLTEVLSGVSGVLLPGKRCWKSFRNMGDLPWLSNVGIDGSRWPAKPQPVSLNDLASE